MPCITNKRLRSSGCAATMPCRVNKRLCVAIYSLLESDFTTVLFTTNPSCLHHLVASNGWFQKALRNATNTFIPSLSLGRHVHWDGLPKLDHSIKLHKASSHFFLVCIINVGSTPYRSCAWAQRLPQHWVNLLNAGLKTKNSIWRSAVLQPVLYMANRLQHDRVILTHIVSVFIDCYPHFNDSEELYLELGDGRVRFSQRWLMHQLIMHLQPCIQDIGELSRNWVHFYPKGCDMLKSSPLPCMMETNRPLSDSDKQKRSILRGNIIDDLLHDEIHKLLR